MNLLFDLDGTLTNPFQGITTCIAHALERMGRPSPAQAELGWCIGPPLRSSFAKLLATDDPALVEKALGFYRERFGRVGLFENKVYDGIPGALAALQAMGHRLYLATSKPRVYAQRIMDHFELSPYFAAIHGAELDGTRNDKTSLISHILEQESIAVSETVMIGDRKYDMIGAGENGVRGFGVLWGYGTKDELEGSGASAFIENPRNLTETFQKENDAMDTLDQIRIHEFFAEYQEEILKLIVTIQQKEFGIAITAEDQPDLCNIREFYQKGAGNFWVALFNDKVIGTISLLDIGHGRAALRKMFVDKAFRGERYQVAFRLLDTLINWAKSKKIQEVYLGTTSKFLAAHRFYEKNGFCEIEKAALPGAFPVMKVDTRFYKFELF